MLGRIGIDLRHVPLEDPGAGVSHASLELAEAIEREAKDRFEVFILRKQGSFLDVRRFVSRHSIDCLLSPSGAVPPFMPVPCYPWVHDVEIFEHPEWFEQSPLKRFVTTRLFLQGVKQAPHVFTVSEDTKRRLMVVAGISEERITVTYQGIKPISVGTAKPYALILGSINPRKNVPFIESLWADVKKIIPQAELVVAGEPRMRFNDEQRDEYIRNATVLLLPSFHEGFGRTALEAMSAGVPVIASNRGAIPEVVGDAGLLLEPTDRAGWIQGITEAFHGRLDGKRGMERARLFSWEKTAHTMLAKLAESC